MLPIVQETLNNRIRLIHDDHLAQESSAIGVWIDTGARYEPEGLKGVAHFAEHLLFKGSKNYTYKEIKHEIEGRGGMLNGFTSQEITCYHAKVLSAQVLPTLDILLDMVRFPLLKETDVEKERQVILEEIKMQNDLPQSRSEMLLDELLWGKTPLGRDVIGTAETVGAISRKNIAAFLEQHYTAPRILIVVCAKAGVPELKKIIAGKFTGYSGSKRPVTKFNPSSVQPGVRIKVERKELAQTHCALGVEGCTRKDPRVWALKLLHVILGANMSSRLFERIREEQALAYDISTACRFYRDSGCFSIHSGLAPEHLGCALRLILKELEKIKRVAVGKKEFQRARDFVLGQMTMAFEHPMERMLYIGESLLGLGIVPSPDEMRQKIIGISTGTIKRLAERLFSGRTMKVALVGSIETAFKTEIEKTLRSAGYHAQER